MLPTNEATKLLLAAEAQGLTMKANYPGIPGPDYIGPSAAKAWEALEACDEMHLSVVDDRGLTLGWALIIPGLDADEVVADYSGVWVERTLEGAACS